MANWSRNRAGSLSLSLPLPSSASKDTMTGAVLSPMTELAMNLEHNSIRLVLDFRVLHLGRFQYGGSIYLIYLQEVLKILYNFDLLTALVGLLKEGCQCPM